MKEIDKVMEEINSAAAEANIELAEITEAGFPFQLNEVVMTVTSDSAGIYVHSGDTPVCAIARAGNPNHCAIEIKSRIRETVEATKAAVERRGALKAEAEAIKVESEQREKAVAALKAAGLDASILKEDFNAEAADAVVEAAKKAVKEANRFPIIGIVPYHDFKLTVRGFAGGIVVLAGNKPCLVTRFPKIGSPKAIGKMCRFIKSDIAALSDCRRRYFESVRQEIDREERLHEISSKLDSANDLLMAASM